ncbi:hypothetical protein M0208_16430 [Sphingomonas sp. SUN019]|uniref:hypothetical protein n=1 Tax=Sphingomonas sp. SUN019 TaxID=2937788 RepID=UPI00216479BD|nr:hypothetical protein [Sphingomonas sp. SUN019]UVO52020.1 hypothetical protein M0208_16430 [Sphingomonas sp. SUN019]
MLMNCAIFYTDRLSDAIVEAMETAAGAGAIVYFEPSEVKRADLFRRAVAVTTVLKFSADRLDGFMDEGVPGTAISIVTYGEAGLELRMGSNRHWCHSYPAPEVRDTCGSGDMVSVGLIDWLLAHRPSRQSGLDRYAGARHRGRATARGGELRLCRRTRPLPPTWRGLCAVSAQRRGPISTPAQAALRVEPISRASPRS